MGTRIIALAAGDRDTKVIAAFDRVDNPATGGDLDIEGGKIKVMSDPSEAIKRGDVIIEFTTPEATLKHLDIAVKEKKAMVIGTTGLDEKSIKIIKDASKKIPIVFSPNMSPGVNLLFKMSGQAAGVLKDSQVTMREAHHEHKKDAPSGTAKKLREVIKKIRGQIDLPIESIREGEIIGDHTVVFEDEFETVTLSHHAKTRDVFAQGAIVAAKFISGKKKGLYSMNDVLGI